MSTILNSTQRLLKKTAANRHYLFHLGMLSKSKGQQLRVAAALHVLFSNESTIEEEISEEAIVAAQNFVDTCIQHTAYIAGRENMDDDIKKLDEGISFITGYVIDLPFYKLS